MWHSCKRKCLAGLVQSPWPMPWPGHMITLQSVYFTSGNGEHVSCTVGVWLTTWLLKCSVVYKAVLPLLSSPSCPSKSAACCLSYHISDAVYHTVYTTVTFDLSLHLYCWSGTSVRSPAILINLTVHLGVTWWKRYQVIVNICYSAPK